MIPPSPPPFVPLEVRVPASTSNLGPGFDLLGMALSLFVRVRVLDTIDGTEHRFAGRRGHATAWPDPESDLFCRAFDAARGGGSSGPRFALEVDSEIPLERGFGSSGAAVAAGLLLGAALAKEAPSPARLLRRGIEFEGHPDNVAASLHGGCTLCHPDAGPGGAPVVLSCAVHPSIGCVVAWPASPLPTARARAALPDRVPFADAVENPRRLALLLEGLRAGDPALLAAGSEDRLHTAHRLPLIRGGAEARTAGLDAGAWSVTISGAGSGLFALGPRAAGTAIAHAMAEAFRAAGEEGEARIVDPVPDPPRVHSRA